jgi:hypothetical protein
MYRSDTSKRYGLSRHGASRLKLLAARAPWGPATRNLAHQEKRGVDKLSDGEVKISGAGLSISWLAVRLSARLSGGDEEEAMKYVMLIYQGTAQERQAALPEEEQKQVYADYQGINQTPGVTSGPPMGLPENATTVRVEGGKTLTTDGPFVGMKEAVGGFFILEADDLDAAIEVAARVPAARYGGAVEIRPSEVYW